MQTLFVLVVSSFGVLCRQLSFFVVNCRSA